MKYVLILVIVIFLSACSSNSDNYVISVLSSDETGSREKLWRAMTGVWKGSQKTQDGGLYEWSMTSFYDGKYILSGRVQNENGPYSQIEVGEWGVSGNVKFIIFKGWLVESHCNIADRTDPTNYDAYQIISLTDDLVEYRDLSDGDLFLMHREAEISSSERITSKSDGCFTR